MIFSDALPMSLHSDVTLNFMYIKKNNFFHTSTNGRDNELQHTHMVLFKSPRDVQQIDVLGKQLGLGNTQRKWYVDATSTPYGHLMIDLSPESNDLLRYSTDVTSFPSEFFLPSSKSGVTPMKDRNSGLLYPKLSNFYFVTSSIHFRRIFLKFSSKHFIRFLCDCCENLLQGNLKGIEKTKLHRLKNIVRKLVSKNTSCKTLASQKALYLLNIVGIAVLRKFSETIEHARH